VVAVGASWTSPATSARPGPVRCKLIPETLLRFHVDGGMAAEIVTRS
jgi:hypothetical protein